MEKVNCYQTKRITVIPEKSWHHHPSKRYFFFSKLPFSETPLSGTKEVNAFHSPSLYTIRSIIENLSLIRHNKTTIYVTPNSVGFRRENESLCGCVDSHYYLGRFLFGLSRFYEVEFIRTDTCKRARGSREKRNPRIVEKVNFRPKLTPAQPLSHQKNIQLYPTNW